MRFATAWIFAATLTVAAALGQESHRHETVLTVCEVLANLNRYADTDVAIVGRLERASSLEDHDEFLSQDRCPHPIVTYGHVWPNKIQVMGWEDGMPQPPRDRPNFRNSTLAAKMTAVRKTTDLGSHQEPAFKSDGHSAVYAGVRVVSNQWAVVYGRILKVPKLRENCGSEGCGGDDVALVIVAEPYNALMLGPKGELLAEK